MRVKRPTGQPWRDHANCAALVKRSHVYPNADMFRFSAAFACAAYVQRMCRVCAAYADVSECADVCALYADVHAHAYLKTRK